MKIDLNGKLAVVTGATGDLGRVIVRTLARCGADIAVHYYHNQEKADELCGEIVKLKRRASAVQANVTELDSVRKMKDQISKELGEPDIVVNAAVIQYKWTSVLEQDPQDFDGQYRSCVLHNLYMAKTFVPSMIEKRWGRVIALNTECSLQCWPTQSAYVSGKHGMNALLQTLAKEIGPYGITVNQVAPGWMYSDRDRQREKVSKEPGQVIKAYEKMLPLKHRGQDQDIANVVAFLASDLAGFITGALIPVNGGGPTIPPWLQ